MADKDENALIKERKKKLDELRSRGIEPYPYSYDTKHKTVEIIEKYKKLEKEQKTKDIVNVAGRLLSLRKMGKVVLHICKTQQASSSSISGRIILAERSSMFSSSLILAI